MGARETPFLDWRDVRARLQPYLDSRGGVIHVEVQDKDLCVPFNNAVSWMLQARGVRVLQINGDDSTRYFDDVLDLLCARLGVTDPTATSHADGVQILSGNTAGGSLTIENVEITLDGEFLQRAERQRRAARCSQITQAVAQMEGRVCLIFFRSDRQEARTLSSFRSMLWDSGLSTLTSDRGLLVIDVYVPPSRREDHGWPLPYQERLVPSATYDEQARRAAIEDLAMFVGALVTSSEHATAFAQGALAGVFKPSEAYAKIPWLLDELGGS